jgi:hypothetical protein
MGESGKGAKKAGSRGCLPKGDGQTTFACPERSNVRLGLAQTGHAVAGLPLATLLEQIKTLEALEDVAFNDEAGDALETFVL